MNSAVDRNATRLDATRRARAQRTLFAESAIMATRSCAGMCSRTLARLVLRRAPLAQTRNSSSANTKKVLSFYKALDARNLDRYVYTLSQVPRRRGEYLFGVAPCLAALHTGRRQIYSIFLKTAVGAKTSELKRFILYTSQKLSFSFCTVRYAASAQL